MKTKLILTWLFQNGLKLGLFGFLAVLLLKSDFSFQFNINSSPGQWMSSGGTDELSIGKSLINFFDSDENINHQQNNKTSIQETTSSPENLSNDYSNMTYHNTSQLSGSKGSKKKKQLAYVDRFADVARSEMRKYGIPASITLAQGLIESNAGESRLSRENNNHFGMKCFSKSCKKEHCSNFTDDSHKDFFRKYATAWESYRAHSIMLNGKRYLHLKKLPASDYKAWSYGLKKAGYATDKRYAEKLIHIIEELSLYQYDD